jgi:hypothetical protein
MTHDTLETDMPHPFQVAIHNSIAKAEQSANANTEHVQTADPPTPPIASSRKRHSPCCCLRQLACRHTQSYIHTLVHTYEQNGPARDVSENRPTSHIRKYIHTHTLSNTANAQLNYRSHDQHLYLIVCNTDKQAKHTNRRTHTFTRCLTPCTKHVDGHEQQLLKVEYAFASTAWCGRRPAPGRWSTALHKNKAQMREPRRHG